MLMSACGGGGGQSDGTNPPPPPPVADPPTEAEAARFLNQAAVGITREQIDRVVAIGFEGWLEEQFGMARSVARWDWLKAHGYDASRYQTTQDGFDNVAWQALIASPDTLRQRVTFALSQILVVGIDGLSSGGGWKQFSAAAYLDVLEDNAFGNLRTLLGAISRNAAMSTYLTFRGNTKADPLTGSLPDENYARELMQLFTIGLVELEADGSHKLVNGQVVETYAQADISGLARVFTGWVADKANDGPNSPDFQRRPLVQSDWRHELGEKRFLGTTIPANTAGEASLNLALDALFAHPNVGPFWARQLIQRLVASNPSAAYVGRVAAVFANDGSGARGNLRAVVKAILLDDEARGTTRIGEPGWGRLREPVLRLAGWARAVKLGSPSGHWDMGDVSDAAFGLAQAPLRSPSVFNFYRPGYVPPNTSIATAGLVAPEFQITNESSVVGFINFMQTMLAGQVGDLAPDYSALLPMADTGSTLMAELNLLLAGGQLSGATVSLIAAAVDSMPSGDDAARANRIRAASLLAMASPEALVQK